MADPIIGQLSADGMCKPGFVVKVIRARFFDGGDFDGVAGRWGAHLWAVFGDGGGVRTARQRDISPSCRSATIRGVSAQDDAEGALTLSPEANAESGSEAGGVPSLFVRWVICEFACMCETEQGTHKAVVC